MVIMIRYKDGEIISLSDMPDMSVQMLEEKSQIVSLLSIRKLNRDRYYIFFSIFSHRSVVTRKITQKHSDRKTRYLKMR